MVVKNFKKVTGENEVIKNGNEAVERIDVNPEAKKLTDKEVIETILPKNSYSIRHINYTIDSIISKIEEGEIIFPEIQRGYVWNNTKKSLLIYSLLNNRSIGVITVIKDNSTGNLYIVDGRQRIETLYNFIKKGNFKLTIPKAEIERLENKNLALYLKGRTYNTLHRPVRQKLKNCEIPFAIIEINDENELISTTIEQFRLLNINQTKLSSEEILYSLFFTTDEEINKKIVAIDKTSEGLIEKDKRKKSFLVVLRILTDVNTLNKLKNGENPEEFLKFRKLIDYIFNVIKNEYLENENVEIEEIEDTIDYIKQLVSYFRNNPTFPVEVKTSKFFIETIAWLYWIFENYLSLIAEIDNKKEELELTDEDIDKAIIDISEILEWYMDNEIYPLTLNTTKYKQYITQVLDGKDLLKELEKENKELANLYKELLTQNSQRNVTKRNIYEKRMKLLHDIWQIEKERTFKKYLEELEINPKIIDYIIERI